MTIVVIRPGFTQSPSTGQLEFEAASVKAVVPGSHAPGWPNHPDHGGHQGNRYVQWQITLKVLIQLAYGVMPYQVSGPAWTLRRCGGYGVRHN